MLSNISIVLCQAVSYLECSYKYIWYIPWGTTSSGSVERTEKEKIYSHMLNIMLDLWDIVTEMKKTHRGGKWPCSFWLLCLWEAETDGNSYIPDDEEGSENDLSLKTPCMTSPFSKTKLSYLTRMTSLFFHLKLWVFLGIYQDLVFLKATKLTRLDDFSHIDKHF